MALNYESTQEADGSFTIRDVEIAALGKWRPSGAGGKIYDLNEDRVAAILDSDAKIREATTLQPVIRDLHPPEVIGGEHRPRKIGVLGPIKRIANKLFADFRGLSEAAYKHIISGQAGQVSCDIVHNWTIPNTETVLPAFLYGASFTGPDFPAIPVLTPIASFQAFQAMFSEDKGEHITLLEPIDEAAQQALFTNQKEEDTLMEQNELDRLKAGLAQNEADLEKKITAFQAEQDAAKTALADDRTAFQKDRVEALIELAVPKLKPDEVDGVRVIAMSLPEENLKGYFEQVMARPDVEVKPKKKSTPTPSGEPEEVSFSQQVWDIASEHQKENPSESMAGSMAFAETMLGKEKAGDWYKEAFKDETRKVNPNVLEVG